jgi:phosphatidylglycerophosphate synthase
MFDAKLRRWIDPPLDKAASGLARLGLGANAATLIGLAFGLGAAVAIAQGHFQLGLALIVGNRLFDGLDGAIARQTAPTDFGGYLDSVADFLFYASVPVAFGIASPANLLPALILTASFVLTGTSFLAYAAIAANRGISGSEHSPKSFLYTTGLAEGGETILAFILMCLLPDHFAAIAYGFAVLCGLTLIQRLLLANATFRSD